MFTDKQLLADHALLEQIVAEDYAEISAIIGSDATVENVQFQFYEDIRLFGRTLPDEVERKKYLESLSEYTIARMAERRRIVRMAKRAFNHLLDLDSNPSPHLE